MKTIWLKGTSNPISYCINRDMALVDGELVTAMEIAENPALRSWIRKQKLGNSGPVLRADDTTPEWIRGQVLDQWGSDA